MECCQPTLNSLTVKGICSPVRPLLPPGPTVSVRARAHTSAGAPSRRRGPLRSIRAAAYSAHVTRPAAADRALSARHVQHREVVLISPVPHRPSRPTTVFAPLRGPSTLGVSSGPHHDPHADSVLVTELCAGLGDSRVEFRTFDTHINDPAFGRAAADRLDRMISGRSATTAATA
ncbi:Tm-1-like ATP-binding domain-containing protein [Streptomyces sp. NBC_00829]|uniref:Tm-1-like ATP-binding domain-containing protein n=1 Tax=Streptomyces sp. NBC_00829 TaxID=2903679 RepID=UPI003862F5AA|nr:Tm-1-like ATP-binding domain-containing protein [Streptomyces sp. NBC_00829]